MSEKITIKEIIDSIDDIIGVQHPDHSMEMYNQAGYDFLELKPQEVIGRKCYELIDRDSECDNCASAKTLKTKKKAISEIYLPEKDIYLKCTSTPIFDENKNIIRIIEHIKDITPEIKLKKQKLELEKQKDKLNWIIEVTDSGTWEWNIQTGEAVFNKKWAEVIGYTLEELEPTTIETWEELTHSDDFENAEKALEQHFDREKDFYVHEFRMKHKAGHWVWIQARGKVTSWTEDGKPLKMFGIHLDISDQKEHNRIIKELNKAVVEFKNLDNEKEICQKTVETAENVLDFYFCNVRLVERDMLINKAVSSKANVELDPRPISENSISSKTYREGKSIMVDNVKNSSEAAPVSSSYMSGMSIPIGNYGVFQAISTEPEAYTKEDLELAELMVSHTAAALERVHYQEDLKYKSFHDSLTDLYNRRFFEEEMQRLDTKRQLPLSIIMADINGLKIINDSYGHEKGDEVLVKTAEILIESLRQEDILARQGGDEFAVLLPNTNSEQVNKIIKRIKNEVILENKGIKIPISIAIGSATKEDPDQNINTILQKADDNMYQNKLSESKSSKSNIVYGLLSTLSAKSYETKAHGIRMSKLAFEFGEALNLSNSELNRLTLLATMHDIGKTSISEEILTKQGDLNDEEWEIIKRHSEQGYKIASATEEFFSIAEDILAHHEHWDGRGYPNGLVKEEIPYLARIISIIDAYDVMVNDRPYNKAISKEEALAEIKSCAGSQFDPELVKVFVEMMT